MSDEPRKILIVGAGVGLGRELARLIMQDDRLRGRVELVEKLPEDHQPTLEPLDLNEVLARIRGDRPELMAPTPKQTRRVEHELLPYHGKSKHDRQRKWWNR